MLLASARTPHLLLFPGHCGARDHALLVASPSRRDEWRTPCPAVLTRQKRTFACPPTGARLQQVLQGPFTTTFCLHNRFDPFRTAHLMVDVGAAGKTLRTRRH